MPLSRKRKKKGKVVGNGEKSRQSKIDNSSYSDQPSGVTLQDLINVMAYQQYVEDGTIVADDVTVHIPEVIPVTVGEGDDKREVGTATPIPGDEGALSFNITDPEILSTIQGPVDHYSIDEENN